MPPSRMDRVRLQLKWLDQAQFAGYYAAAALGYYRDEALDVTILPLLEERKPDQEVLAGRAEIGIDWLPSLLSARDKGFPLIQIAQIFQRSAMREVAFSASGIHSIPDLKGHRVGAWFDGNEYELLAALEKYGLDPKKDVKLIAQPEEDAIDLLLGNKVDALAVMTYNELRLFFEAEVKPEDLTIIDFNSIGTAMLEDGLIVREDWLHAENHKSIAARFLRASIRGWEYCRDHEDQALEIVMKRSPLGGKEHQRWMLKEVNRLIWDSSTEPGYLSPEAFRKTADICLRFGVIKTEADEKAYTHEIHSMALAGLKGAGRFKAA